MTLGIFANCIFCLKVKYLPRQQKKKLQTDIKENGGKFSFLLNPQVFPNLTSYCLINRMCSGNTARDQRVSRGDWAGDNMRRLETLRHGPLGDRPEEAEDARGPSPAQPSPDCSTLGGL